MIRTTGYNGRLGNQIIRNLAVSLLAEKHNLMVDYYNKELIDTKLGIVLFSGSNTYNEVKLLTDDNYFDVYNETIINYTLDPNNHYFQTVSITNFIYKYLHSDKVRTNIIEKNSFKDRYNANNDVFIHIRLTDVEHFNPGANYYLNAIKYLESRNIHYDTIYLSTDDKEHFIINRIFESYPNAKLIQYDEITTFQFASTCKNIILSHGSFSALIGYLAFFSNVFYKEYIHEGKIDYSKQIWYGNMFSIDNWIKLK